MITNNKHSDDVSPLELMRQVCASPPVSVLERIRREWPELLSPHVPLRGTLQQLGITLAKPPRPRAPGGGSR